MAENNITDFQQFIYMQRMLKFFVQHEIVYKLCIRRYMICTLLIISLIKCVFNIEMNLRLH